MSLDPGDRTYHVSDERLRAFARLSAAEKLAWIEQCSAFIRLARIKPAATMNQEPGVLEQARADSSSHPR